MLPTLSFTGITPERWKAIGAKVELETGIAVSGPAGSADRNGISLRWQYDQAGGTLEIQCLAKPFFVPAATVQARISNFVLTS